MTPEQMWAYICDCQGARKISICEAFAQWGKLTIMQREALGVAFHAIKSQVLFEHSMEPIPEPVSGLTECDMGDSYE